MFDRVRLIRFNESDSVSLRFKNSDQDWLPEYKQVDRVTEGQYRAAVLQPVRFWPKALRPVMLACLLAILLASVFVILLVCVYVILFVC